MRRFAPVIVAAALVATALLPVSAIARPGFYEIPPSRTMQLLPAHGTHGYRVDILVVDGRPQLTAVRTSGKALSFVSYQQTKQRDAGDDLDADFGAAGKLEARFVSEKVQEQKAPERCIGEPTVTEIGWFVGTLKFHGANGFTSFEAHRLRGSVTHSPRLVCRRESRGVHRFTEGEEESVLRVIAGTPSGNTYFSAEALGGAIAPFNDYIAFRRHKEGAVTILETALVLPAPPLAIPDLTKALPTTATIEPPAPFSGSATLEVPSRATATLSGDLAVDLPTAGEVPLTGPGIAAGLCRDYTCTKSLPKALRPHRPRYGFALEEGEAPEFQTIH